MKDLKLDGAILSGKTIRLFIKCRVLTGFASNSRQGPGSVDFETW